MTAPRFALLVLSSLIASVGCIEPVYDETIPPPNTWATCCNETSRRIDTHLAGKGEQSTSQIFPGCSCDEGPLCQPLYEATQFGCSPMWSPADGGATFQDAGTWIPTDAGTSVDGGTGSPSDAGIAPDAGGTFDSGVPFDAGFADAGSSGQDAGSANGSWSACCVSGLVASCFCPSNTTCVPAKFTPCANGTCRSTGSCTSQ